MLRILTPEPGVAVPPAGDASPDSGENDSTGELEIVLGRRQVASLSFVVIVALALASGTSYLAGKAAAGRATVPSPQEQSQRPPEPPPLSPSATPGVPAAAKSGLTGQVIDTAGTDAHAVPSAAGTSGSNAGVNALLAADKSLKADESVFAEPVPGSLYIQVGALDRVPAMILTAGLRSRGFPSLAATGPSATIFRVLVGPYKNLPEYQNAKEAIGQMGITAFGRYNQ